MDGKEREADAVARDQLEPVLGLGQQRRDLVFVEETGQPRPFIGDRFMLSARHWRRAFSNAYAIATGVGNLRSFVAAPASVGVTQLSAWPKTVARWPKAKLGRPKTQLG